MSQTYCCSNCQHYGRLADVSLSARDGARIACPVCGVLIDTVSITGADANTEGPQATPTLIPAPIDDRGNSPQAAPTLIPAPIDQKNNETVDWKSQSPLPLVPGYEMIREIGRGGMGVVYRARCLRLNRIVALKMILGGPFGSSDQLARFRTETEAVAQLQHANIVQIYEVGEFEGRPYCAFEYVDGGSLAAKIFRNPQPSRESAEMVENLARAIHSAHERGIMHRDLKPENILLTRNGAPKICDFGLAKRLEAETGQTQTGSILGTPGYMSPEQAAGKTREVGPAADVWALGAILYHLLTGQPPFHGATLLDTLEQVRTREPVPPRRLRPKLSRDLEVICLKCLEKDPHRRYASAQALADDLHRFLHNEQIHARPASRWERAVRRIKRNPTTAALLGLLFVVAALLAGSLAWLWRSQSPHAQASPSNKPYALTIPKGLPAVAIPGDNPLTEARVDLGKQLFFDKRLSADNSFACATCHDPAKGWSNGKAVAEGVAGQDGSRSVPSIVNVAYQNFLFWDGRSGSLEEQALVPIVNPTEMGMPSPAEVESRLNRIGGYREQFQQAFGTDATAENVGKALAAFERTVLSGDAPYDRYKAGDADALSEPALRGMKLFFHKAHCSACHSSATFSDGGFHNIGIGVKNPNMDVGREKVSGLLGDRGSFKTPSLREIARTAPYMHDGSLATLEEVIDHYDRGGVPNPQLDEEIYPLKLAAQEKHDLLVFLREGLTGSAYPFASSPKLPD